MRHLITTCAVFLMGLNVASADTVVGDSKPVTPGSQYYAAGQACLKNMAAARAWAKAQLGSSDTPWVNEPVTCEVAADTGCGSGMYGHELQFLTGQGTHCGAAVFIPAYVYHEWAHGLNHELAGVSATDLDEALADTFAVYLTGNPRFGEGMYQDREHSWQRDLSDRKIYDGPTKELYTQSETLSGAWWDLRVRLINRFGQAKGAALAVQIFFQHLRELGATAPERQPRSGVDRSYTEKTLENDYTFARAAVADVVAPELADPVTNAAVACELSNAFADHGFSADEPGCARSKLVTDVDQIAALLAAGKGVVAAAAPLSATGSVAVFPIAIPEKATLKLTFTVDAAPGARVQALALKTRISYPYSDDLLMTVTAPDGRTRHDIYKGEEELAVPDLLTDRFAFSGAPARGVWTVELVNAGQGLGGSVDELELNLILR